MSNTRLQASLMISAFLLLGSMSSIAAQTLSQSEAVFQAKNLYERIARVPGTEADIATMANLILQGRTDEAAFIPMKDVNFYKLNLKRMFQAWTNAEGSNVGDLNDMTATLIGYVVDNRPFNGILFESYKYLAEDYHVSTNSSADGVWNTDVLKRGEISNSGDVTPLLRSRGNRWNFEDNLHYEQLESNVEDWPFELRKWNVNDIYSIMSSSGFGNNDGGATRSATVPLVDQAGVLSQRTFGYAAYLDGTNRRQIKMIFRDFLCAPLEQVHDINVPYTYVRADIERDPDGDSANFVSTCAGCHGGMDSLSHAFIRLDWDDVNAGNVRNQLAYYTDTNRLGNRAGNADPKLYRAFSVQDGYDPREQPVNLQNSWSNPWATGQNASLGWRPGPTHSDVTKGVGARALGEVLAHTTAFSQCMVEHSFKNVCGRDATPSEKTELKQIAIRFENGVSTYADHEASGRYNLKSAFAQVSALCFGR